MLRYTERYSQYVVTDLITENLLAKTFYQIVSTLNVSRTHCVNDMLIWFNFDVNWSFWLDADVLFIYFLVTSMKFMQKYMFTV